MDTDTSISEIIQQLKQVNPNLRNHTDAIVFVLHLCMKQNGFRFVGCGPKNDDSASEVSIPNWNSSTDSYQFRYRHDNLKSTVLLKFVVLEGQLLVHAMLIESMAMFHLDIKIDEFVNTSVHHNNYDTLFNSLDNLIAIFKLQIVDSLLSGETTVPKDVPKRNEHPVDYDPLRIPNRTPQRGPPNPWIEPGFDQPYSTPFGVGHNDVFPEIPSGPSGLWSGPGSGNLVGPQHPGFNRGFPSSRGRGNLPPGHPPGARFDPFGPPGTGNRFGNPDNDDLPPPKGSGYDNMFL